METDLMRQHPEAAASMIVLGSDGKTVIDMTAFTDRRDQHPFCPRNPYQFNEPHVRVLKFDDRWFVLCIANQDFAYDPKYRPGFRITLQVLGDKTVAKR